jgi:hypothetical protein
MLTKQHFPAKACRTCCVLAILFSCALLPGCRPRVERGRISGKVTYESQPVPEGLVLFSNVEKGIHMTASLKAGGVYEIITAEGKGLPLGTYQVCVCPPLNQPTNDPNARLKTYANIPAKYSRFETSGLTLNVQSGQNTLDVAMTR